MQEEERLESSVAVMPWIRVVVGEDVIFGLILLKWLLRDVLMLKLRFPV